MAVLTKIIIRFMFKWYQKNVCINNTNMLYNHYYNKVVLEKCL